MPSFAKTYLPQGIIVLVVLLQATIFVQTLGDFYFEDDTPHLVFVRDHAGPIAYFTDKELVSKLSLGHAITPWFAFTFWIDHTFAEKTPAFAYAPTLFSYMIVALLFYALLAKLIKREFALFGTLVWMFLPSTLVTLEFLSTRHYLEGLALSLASFFFALRVHRDAPHAHWNLAAAALCYLAATTAKEVFVTSTLFILVAIFLHARKWLAIGVMAASGAAYAAYRLWALDNVGKSLNQDFLSTYPEFLKTLPAIWVGNDWGYLLFGLLLVVWSFVVWQKLLSWKIHLFMLANIGLAMLTILPVSYHVVPVYHEAGTWLRVVFVLNTMLLFWFIWLVSLLPKAGMIRGCLLLLAIPVLTQLPSHNATWDQRKADAEQDAKFYIANDDKLLYSKLPAPWYMYGIHHLYKPGQEKHYLTFRADNATPQAYVEETLEKFDTVWSANEQGEIVENPELLERIRKNVAQGRTPFHAP
jgi:hypothetical protein